MSEQANELMQQAGASLSPEAVEQLCSSELANKFAVRLHLGTLLFEVSHEKCFNPFSHRFFRFLNQSLIIFSWHYYAKAI